MARKTVISTACAFFAARETLGSATADLIDACKAEGVHRSEGKLRPRLMEAGAKFYGIELTTAERGTRAGELVFDKDHKSYEAAKKAVNRALALVLHGGKPGKGNKNSDPVARVEATIEKMEPKDIRRLIAWLKKEGHI
jgi:hypothetical protein